MLNEPNENLQESAVSEIKVTGGFVNKGLEHNHVFKLGFQVI